MWWHIMKMTVTDTHYNTQSLNPEGEFTEEAIWSLDIQWGQNDFENKCHTSTLYVNNEPNKKLLGLKFS